MSGVAVLHKILIISFDRGIERKYLYRHLLLFLSIRIKRLSE